MSGEKELQEVNITDLWNKNLFESIQRLQDFERICRDGAVSITEYLNIAPQRMSEIQFQYLKMMASEMGILLGNARARLSKEYYLRARLQLRKIKHTIDMDPQKIFVTSYNQQSNSSQHYLSEEFYNFLSQITSIREGVITELRDILFGVPMEKASGMEKTGEVLRQ